MTALFDRVEAAADFLRDQGAKPETMVILGTGLGGFGAGGTSVPYADIPHFPHSTSPGHEGALHLTGKAMVMSGRFHYYEGYPMEEITLPVRVARALGAKTLLVTAAVGGMNPQLRLGDIVAVDDHIHLMGDSPLRGENDERLGPRFPDMSRPYDPELIDRAEALAMEAGFRLPRGVLATVSGPQLETRAEYRYLRAIGADLVGMSTTPEAIVATHAGMRCCALCVVTDVCLPDALEAVDVESIIAVANEAAPRLAGLLTGLIG
ncbi:MAG: purine-nucleoside phosphorylase [Planctomycetota bacterium]|jgi:purine-nucleoside phosphorylase